MELGSNFDLDVNDLYMKPNNVITYLSNYNTVWFNYGRSAIKAINIHRHRRILLPEFICESVISCFPEDNIVFYKKPLALLSHQEYPHDEKKQGTYSFSRCKFPCLSY